MFTAILNAIAAIPTLIKSIQNLIAYFDKLDQAGFFNAVAKNQQDLAAAKTPEEYKAASQEINDLLKKL